MRDISGVTMVTHRQCNIPCNFSNYGNGCKHWKIKDDRKRECYNPILNQ